MKYIFFTVVLSAFFSIASAQFKSVGLTVGGGYTVIDVQKVNEPIELYDWNNFGLILKGFAEYQLSEGRILGIELGRNRLYYWEYQYPGNSYYTWRTEWTTNAVVYFSKYFGDNFYMTAGAGIHIFYNGTVPGLLASIGTSFDIGNTLSIPLTLRIEPVFGTGTPIAVNLGTGIKFNLLK
jgi:hypothetical protein